ncbi:MBL fold metallo-hydrolase [Paenibacillus sp. GCM10012307]|uniref:MBL fold metallo-hydrolase n=1 Tax=Paenibacillus roseus TaxID=2798579 RepID=A0A934J2P3_9BACL|nr:MBL fold metallo-hydrolase [Paenibacillus roseus]MBJ6360484.1 MBL fold metallo-hydrolase [Paenibacillus roseus]
MGKYRFTNSNPVHTEHTMAHFKRWRKERARKLKDYSFVVPSVPPDLEYLRDNSQKSSITWIGHSTFFIQHSGLNIVTDPVWSGKMAFQKRLAPPGIPIRDMPPIDIVLISHSHYDHLSMTSLRRLAGNKELLVPAGLKNKLLLKGFFRIREFQWWDSAVINGVRFTFVPSQHWTRRTPWDMNRSHWGGWVIEPASGHEESDDNRSHKRENNSGAHYALPEPFTRPVVSDNPTIYFAGDSGYFNGFKEIGSRFQVDVALMPIGAYEPEWFMGPQHVTPEQALQAFQDTGAKWFVPMHYGTFKLADDTPREALDRLESGREYYRIDPNRLVILPLGETWRLDGG